MIFGGIWGLGNSHNTQPDGNSWVQKYSIPIAVVVLCTSIAGGLTLWWLGDFKTESAGQFGDFVGGLTNPIMAFLALIAVVSTIRIQVKELKATREELRLTKEELASSRTAQEALAKTSAKQNFEDTFFRLMTHFHDANNNDDGLTPLHTNDLWTSVAANIREYSITNAETLWNEMETWGGGNFRESIERVVTRFTVIVRLIDQANLDAPELYEEILANSLDGSTLEMLLVISKGMEDKRTYNLLLPHLRQYSAHNYQRPILDFIRGENQKQA